MRKSIKKNVWIRVAAAIGSSLLLSVLVIFGIIRIQGTQTESTAANALLNKAQTAQVAHYKWSANLSNALYAGTEFTGSMDPTTCVLGEWIYGELGTDDATIVSLRDQLEPLHKALHESASGVLETLKTNPAKAQEFYQTTIQSNLTTLVGLLDDVVARGTEMSNDCAERMNQMILLMMAISVVCCILSLICLFTLANYVFRRVLGPILHIIEQSRPMMEGRLQLKLEHKRDDEIGDLAGTLERSLALIRSYVEDINRMMAQLSQGSFDVHVTAPFIGDFRSIEEALESFTSTMSSALAKIGQAEQKVSSDAEQLSSSSQALAQGATEQASAVQELFATLDDLSKNAEHNADTASSAQQSANRAREQVSLSSEQMKQMVAAMDDIANASQKIGEIIATIENIAFQTNILALNAAVEAARAGSAGKGFAVVSNEVRSLAAQSDRAAKATKELIENSVIASERGSRIVGEVSETLQQALNLVVQSSGEIGTIAEAVHGEATSIAQVTEGISQISAVVQTNSASSEESAAVSSELFEQVRLLQKETRRFQLKRGS